MLTCAQLSLKWVCYCIISVGTINIASYGFCGFATYSEGANDYVIIPGEQASDLNIFSLSTFSAVGNLTVPDSKSAFGMVMDMKYFLTFSGCMRLLAAYEDGSIVLWDVSQRKVLDRLQFLNCSATSVDFNACCNKGVCGTVSNKLFLFSINSLDKLLLEKDISITNDGINCVKFRPDGKLFLTGSILRASSKHIAGRYC